MQQRSVEVNRPHATKVSIPHPVEVSRPRPVEVNSSCRAQLVLKSSAHPVELSSSLQFNSSVQSARLS